MLVSIVVKVLLSNDMSAAIVGSSSQSTCRNRISKLVLNGSGVCDTACVLKLAI
ncbi:hypothetical protein QE390_005187 [Siphonobacter sp. SORGH_AS 1065]|nr:hypothetical protein [Siphonobacter sp. SORGH_AS_1065]